MARLAKYVQRSTEEKRYSVEYADWVDTGEYIQSVSFSISPTTTPPLTVPSSSIMTGDAGTNTKVKFFVGGGLTGNIYTVTITAVTSGGQTKQDDVLFVVQDT